MAHQNFIRWGDRTKANIQQLENGGVYGPVVDEPIKAGENVWDTTTFYHFGFAQNPVADKEGVFLSGDMEIVFPLYDGESFTYYPTVTDRCISGLLGPPSSVVYGDLQTAMLKIDGNDQMNDTALGISYNNPVHEGDFLATQHTGFAWVDYINATALSPGQGEMIDCLTVAATYADRGICDRRNPQVLKGSWGFCMMFVGVLGTGKVWIKCNFVNKV